MATGISTTILKYQFDDAAGNKARQGIERIGKATDSVTARINRLTIEASHTAKELALLDLKLNSGTLSGKELEVAVLQAARLEEQLHQVNEELTSLSSPKKSGRSILAELGTELRNLPALALPGVPFSTETIARVFQSLGKLSSEGGFPTLAQTMGIVKQKAGELINALGGINTVGPVASLAALALIIQEIGKQAAISREKAGVAIDANRKLANLIATNTIEQIDKELEIAQVTRRAREGEAAEAERIYKGLAEGVGIAGVAALGLIGKAGENARAPLDEAKNKFDETQLALQEAINEEQALTAARSDARVIARSMIEAEAELAKKRQEQVVELTKQGIQVATTFNALNGATAESARTRLNAIAAERDAIQEFKHNLSGPELEELNRQFFKLGVEARQILEALPALEDLERRKQLEEDQKNATQALYELSGKAIDIQQQGEEKLADIRERGVEKVADAEERLADARQKLADFDAEANDKRQKVEDDFRKDDLDRVKDFIRKLKKTQAEGDKELLRLAEDHEQRLLDAEIANSTEQFIREQQQFDLQSRRKKEDLSDEAQQRLDDLEVERQKAREVRDERIASLDAENAKKRADLQTEINEREAAVEEIKTQIEDQKAAQIKATEDALRKLVEGYDQSAQKMIDTTKAGFAVLEQAGIDTFSGIIQDLQNKAKAYYSSSVQQYTASGYSGGSSTSYLKSGSNTYRAFARGTLGVDRPTNALVGDVRPGFAEAIIPYNKSAGLAAELQRLGITGGAPSVDLRGAVFGPGVTAADLEAFGVKIVNGIAQGVSALRSGALPND